MSLIITLATKQQQKEQLLSNVEEVLRSAFSVMEDLCMICVTM